jgi:hypothetical protein
MPIKKLRGLCQLWQSRLGLKDWAITVRYGKPSDMTPSCVGNSSWEPDQQTAEVIILRPRYIPHDIEGTLIHELLHVRFEGHRAPKVDTHLERAINAVTTALQVGYEAI